MAKKQPHQEYPVMFNGLQPPQSLKVSRTIGDYAWTDRRDRPQKGVLHLAGKGPRPADVLFVSPCVLEEELEDRYQPPALLKGPAASLFLRNIKKVGFEQGDYHYTSLVRYNIPGLRVKGHDIRWSLPLFENEMQEIKPKIVVCLGKASLDLLVTMKVKIDDVRGGFLYSDKYGCMVYPMDTIVLPLKKPEYIERFLVDLKQVYFELQSIRGVDRVKMTTDYHVLETADQLDQCVNDPAVNQHRMPAIDSEWSGQTFVDGTLRTFQFCWKPGSAACIKLHDETGARVMDVDNATVGQILGKYLARPDVKYIGHYASADTVWMKTHFNLPIYKKVGFDTMFAQQLIDEYADLKLERLAVRYTDLGRYDLELYLWKKSNKVKDSEGYGRIPDRILIPYSMRDVDTTKRVHPILLKQLVQQGLLDYFYRINLPFVTDCYASWMLTGLPVDRAYAEDMRRVFVRNQKLLIVEFKEKVRKEANLIFLNRLMAINPIEGPAMFKNIRLCFHDSAEEALEMLKEFAGPDRFPEILPVYEHWIVANEIIPDEPKSGFNHSSTEQMKRWLFDVKGLMPINTTKKDNVSMAWEKVLAMKPEKQVEFQPACDKRTINIYSREDKLIAQVQELKSVANIVKSFLKEVDPDTGEEEGIFKWIQSDGTIRCNWGSTETGRPRCIHADTLIPCLGGDKRVVDIKPGDKVWTHKNRWREVTQCHTLPAEEMYEVTFSNGKTLKATLNHRLLTQAGNWVSLNYVYQQGTHSRSGDLQQDSGTLSTISDDLRRSVTGDRMHNAHGALCMQEGFDPGAIQEIEGQQIRELKERAEEPALREARIRIPSLPRGVPGWLRLFDEVGLRPEVFRASHRSIGETGCSGGTVPEGDGSSPYRWKQNKQHTGQPSYNDTIGTLETALQASRDDIWIEKIVPCGTHLVYDITVAEDNSYETAGCFSHNSWSPNCLNYPKAVTKPIEAGFKRINLKLTDEKRAELTKKGFAPPLIEMVCKQLARSPVSLRSAIKAHPGYCFTDADLKTAEVVGLGYLSGDRNLMDATSKEDEQFGLKCDKPELLEKCRSMEDRNEIRTFLDETAGKSVKPARIKFDPAISRIPESAQLPELLSDPDAEYLIRDGQGKILHPKRDIHWEMGESFMKQARERLNKDQHRGAGKVGVFCLSEGEEVITDRGLVPIQDVQLTDKLWDGEEWVRHEGVVCKGEELVHFYAGLWATDNHVVYGTRNWSLTFGEARAQRIALERGAHTGSGVYPSAFTYGSDGDSRVSRVYDILNAGPRHRFICSGVLVSNSIPYDASPKLIEMQVHSITGIKPEEGTGQKVIDAYKTSFSIASEYLEERARAVESDGYFRSVSGRIRHFCINRLEDVEGMTPWQRKSILSPLTREARNYPLQEIVAATMARANIMLLDKLIEQDMKSRVMILLYDAMTVLGPMEERQEVRKLLKWAMSTNNVWDIEGRKLQFEIDCDYTIRWATDLTEAEKKLFIP